jgi:hypothetical protein
LIITVRNTYILINFGDFVDGSTSNVADPYIQLLSISDKTKIHQDFVNARLGGSGSGNNRDSKENGALSLSFSLGAGVGVTALIAFFSL